MVGVVLEKLRTCHLFMFALVLLVLQIACFLLGGLISPSPNSAENYLGNMCIDPLSSRSRRYSNDPKPWFFSRKLKNNNKTCRPVDKVEDIWERADAEQVVFSFQMPLPKEGIELKMSRLFQELIGVINFDIEFNESSGNKVADDAEITLDARLGYRDEGDEKGDWKELAHSIEKRPLKCVMDTNSSTYDCHVLPLFSLGSVAHDYYLLNIRVPVNDSMGVNTRIGDLRDIWVTVIHQNGGFTLVLFSLKTAMFLFVVIGLFVFRRAVARQTNRGPNLLEQSIVALSVVVAIMDCPIEWLSLVVDWPIWLVVSDIRQGLFYATLLCFWIIFTGEHMMDDAERNRIMLYWKHLMAIGCASACLFIFEVSERGVQLSNPFYSVWSHPDATRLAMASIILAGIAMGIYLLFLSYMVIKLLRQMLSKRALLPNLPDARRRFYSGVIYRFCVFIGITLVCAALTVAFYMVSQLDEDSWKWEDDRTLEYHSAFITGVFGMWNLYILALLVLYAPAGVLPAGAIGSRAAAADSCGERPFLVDSDPPGGAASNSAHVNEPVVAYSAIRANRDTTPELSEGIAFLRKANID